MLALMMALTAVGQEKGWKQAESIAAEEAHQGAAADERFVYAIASESIGKYDRKTGERVGVSVGKAHHLNSGFVFEGKLYCAHSNFPKRPELSEIFVLDPETMKLELFKDFGNYGGSLTWAVVREGRWWCNFALYDKENAGTFLVEFDRDWKEVARYTYPEEVVKQLGRYSVSGGVWRGEELVVTGHTDPVVFRLRVPKEGKVLELVGKEKCPFSGQGIANDPVSGGLVGIVRGKKRLVVAVEGK